MKCEPAAETEHQLLQGLVLRDDAGREEPVLSLDLKWKLARHKADLAD